MKRLMTTRRKYAPAEGGYALLMAVFFAALALVAAMAVAPSLVIEGKREKEKEMIWRGKQYVRGVKLYYRKTGRFPAQLDDLYKPKTGSVRFLRQAYKDPMNKEDGSWRLIYVGPAGQLIGSLKPRSNLQLPAPGIAAGAAGTGGAATGTPGAAAGGGASGTGQGGAAGATPSGAGTAPAGSVGAKGDDGASGQGGDQKELPPGNVDSPTVFGGKIIGVGSKIDKRSVIFYDKARNYRLFEFIWDPSKDTGGVNQPLLSGPGTGQPGQPGQPGQGGQTPANPNANPTPPPQN
jgi:hypothetical protein